jgi:predicted TIM-barrel fold metal-dependent hydrolase
VKSTARIRRIATEEAFSIPAVAEAMRGVVRSLPAANLDLNLLRTIYDDPAEGTVGSVLLRRLLDLEDERVRDMDANGVDMHLLSLTSPGVQMFDADTATELAAVSNDILRATIARHPSRFTGLASFAPHSPKRAAKEMDRAINSLGLHGFIVNSHTNGEYLDDPKFWPILEAAEHLRRPLYIHPRAPSDGMADPFRSYGIEGAMWGYGIETGTHVIRLIVSGAFDRFPNLKIVIGHMGEAIPFWLWRIDFMHARAVSSNRARKIQLKPSEYFRRNFAITTSGMESAEALEYSIKVLGAENIMWAIDYPYQPTAPAVAFMDAFSASDEQKALLYHRNAEHVFGIKPVMETTSV